MKKDIAGQSQETSRVENGITSNKMTNEALMVFQANILSGMQVAICVVDENFRITYWNGMAEKMFGWLACEAIGSPSKDIFRTVSPLNREKSIDNLLKNNGYTGEAVYLKKDGEEIYTNVVCSVIRGTNGEYKGNVSTYCDITDRKRAEEALRESERKALSLVEELEEADRNKNQFISVLSYELRNPLAVISAGFQILDVTKDISLIAKAHEVMRRQTNQLCKLVDDLLELTRIKQNKIKLNKEDINLNETVKDVVEDIRLEYEKRRKTRNENSGNPDSAER